MNTNADPLAALFNGDARLDAAAGEAIIAQGASAAPALIRIMVDPELGDGDSRGCGYAPIHAVILLAALGSTDAIGPMIGLLDETDSDDLLHDRILVELPKFGAAALEPLLVAHDEVPDPERRAELCMVLAQCGVQDDRVLNRLFAAFEHNPGLMAGLLGTYGDRAALPILERAFELYEIDEHNPARNRDLTELADGLEQLGGLTAAHVAKLERAAEVRSAHAARVAREPRSAQGSPSIPARRRERPGRNAACWCGSGKKYKRCHLGGDQRAERVASGGGVQAAPLPKLSEALIAIGGEYFDKIPPTQVRAREALAALLMVAWNVAVLRETGDDRGGREQWAKLAGIPDPAIAEAMVAEFIKRKRLLFPDDDRLVMDVRFDSGDRLLVASVSGSR